MDWWILKGIKYIGKIIYKERVKVTDNEMEIDR